MKILENKRYVLLFLVLFLVFPLAFPLSVFAAAGDIWWDEAWPYRIPVNVTGSGVAQVSLNFTDTFNELGLIKGLLDIRSIRVVPYNGSYPGNPVPHAETYSVMLEDADNPQIGWSSSGVYWSVNDGNAVADKTRYSQGSGSLKAVVDNLPGGYGYPGVELRIASDGLTDWRDYEAFVYDIWPEVNASALDQAPDLYSFKLYNTTGCSSTNITQGGPPMAFDQWNYVSVSLDPFNTCTTPSFDNITRMEFHTRDNETVSGNSGFYDDGDQLTLWFDNIRLVDQDTGVIRWTADGNATKYYIYFDTLMHEGHLLPNLASLDSAALTGSAGPAEAGGYYHKISGANVEGLGIWTAPCIEKILRTQAVPTVEAPLRIQAAKDEFEPFQIVVRAGTAQNLSVSITDFTSGNDVIPVSDISLHRVDFVNITQLSDHFGRIGPWPDPLYPVAMGADIFFPANSNQPVWFTIHVPRDAVAGVYNATVSIGSAAVPVQLEVWDFTLPSKIHLASEWGFGWSSIVEEYKGVDGGVQPCYWDLVDALYEDFADHRLTPKGVGWPAGLSFDYDCNTGVLDVTNDGNIWYFDSTAKKYLDGNELDNGTGFPSFLIKGPSSNWPPDSRPSLFCGQSRGSDPPGNSAYNASWFQYWSAVSGYLGNESDYAQKGYYHIVNEPQTFADYDIVAYLAKETKAAAPNVRIMVSEQVENQIYDNGTYPGAKIDIWVPTITNYEVTKSHNRQQNHGEDVWWYFLYGNRPPLPNPTVMDRPGIEARITPWLAWMERVEGLLYYSITDWDPDPWSQTWSNASCNGDAFMLYPPKDGTIAFDACSAQSNRLVPSIRWELMREGMEDYEYLWVLTNGNPQIGVSNPGDDVASQFIYSRTRFSRVPTDLYNARASIVSRYAMCPYPNDDDSDDDGILDIDEDANANGTVDAGETDPCNPDSDGDGIQDGTERGVTSKDVGPDTNPEVFIPDADPNTTTDPLDPDCDNDGKLDGEEDTNFNGKIDDGESNPKMRPAKAMPWILLLLE